MNIISPLTQLLLSLSMLKGVGPAALKKAAQFLPHGDFSLDELANNIPSIGRALSVNDDWQIAQDNAVQQIEQATRHNARILSPIDSEYPQLLAATKDDPFILYIQGALAKRPDRSVAIIGTRKPTAHGLLITTRIANFFAEQGWSIVSGLAIGCDAIAHQAALASAAHTVAVMAHGLHMIAPSRHKNLAQDILAAGGALISEYPFGKEVQNQQYVKRDRTQAGMAQGVVMIQSDLKGGSLHASRASLDYDRWLAVPYPTDKDRMNGEPKVQANLLIADGADDKRTALLRCDASDLKRIIILGSRNDYFRMIESVGGRWPDSKSPPISEEPATTEPSLDKRDKSASSSMLGGVFSAEQTDNSRIDQLPVVTKNSAFSKQQQPQCRIVLSISRLSDEKTTQHLQDALDHFKNVAKFGEKIHVLDTLHMRLQYIQTQINDVVGMIGDHLDMTCKKDRLFIQFSIESILMHMKQAADGVGVLGACQVVEVVNLAHPESKKKQPLHQQLNLFAAKQPLARQITSALDIWNRSANSHINSVVFDDEVNITHDDTGNQSQVCETVADIYFHDIVYSFSKKLSRLLYSACEGSGHE